MRRVSIVILALTVAALACGVPSSEEVGQRVPPSTAEPVESASEIQPSEPSERPTELSSNQIEQIAQAVVQIMVAQRVGGDLEPMWGGSGTLISPTGEILTNCHVACDAPVIVILMTVSVDIPAEPQYIAELTAFDEVLDLALVQIRTDMDGNPVSPTNLPYLPLGDSDGLMLGDPVRIFGYPDVGGATITFTSGSISGFESAEINDVSERVIIKTDAEISSGNSGGTAVDLFGNLIAVPTAVNPDVRGTVTLGSIGILRPVNLIGHVRSGTGPGLTERAGAGPPPSDPDIYEPNDSPEQAVRLESSEVVQGYISWEDDLDFYLISPLTTNSIQLRMTNIPNDIADYDLYLVDDTQTVIAWSEGITSEESINYTPPRPGSYWVVVVSYSGASTTQPYTLAITYDGSEGGVVTGGIRITGTAVNANTGMPLEGGTFGLLTPGTSCRAFFGSPDPSLDLIVVSGITDSNGDFELLGVPRGATYTAFFIHGLEYACEDDWLEVYPDDRDFDLGILQMEFD